MSAIGDFGLFAVAGETRAKRGRNESETRAKLRSERRRLDDRWIGARVSGRDRTAEGGACDAANTGE